MEWSGVDGAGGREGDRPRDSPQSHGPPTQSASANGGVMWMGDGGGKECERPSERPSHPSPSPPPTHSAHHVHHSQIVPRSAEGEGRWGWRDTVASVAGSAAQQAPTARYGLAQSRAKEWGVGSSTVARSLSLFKFKKRKKEKHCENPEFCKYLRAPPCGKLPAERHGLMRPDEK